MTRLAFTLLLTAALTGLAQAASEAERIATRTGEVIGAASMCGTPEGELLALSRKVIGWARDTAKDAGELRRAQAAHEAAVIRSAAQAKKAGEGACAATARAFRDLEKERR